MGRSGGSIRIPKVVLNRLTTKAKESHYVFERLYRHFYSKEFYYEAYVKLYKKKDNNLKGMTNSLVDDLCEKRIKKLIERLKNQTYQPVPVRQTAIPKGNEKTGLLGILTFEDKLVQEVARRLLESIYEPQFSVHSHGFRPNLSCHTALQEIQKNFTGASWFIEGNLKGFFDHIDHHVLMGILRKKIRDEKFINLIWKFVRAGYMEDWVFHKTYSGALQGGILSPLLSNIYFNEFDQYVEQYIENYTIGDKHMPKVTDHQPASKMAERTSNNKRDWSNLTGEQSKVPEKQLKNHDNKELFCLNQRRQNYVRYADCFLLGGIGSKKEIEQIKHDLKTFFKEHLKLNVSNDKMFIMHSKKNARFLGYEIRVIPNQHCMKMPNEMKKRKFNDQVKLFVPPEKYIQKLVQLKALKIGPTNGWKPVHRSYLVHTNDLEIIRTYNSEIEGYYNYYRLATNVHVLQSFRQAMKYSMLKTYANKYKSTVRKIILKHNINGKFGVRYDSKEGSNFVCFTEQRMEKNDAVKEPTVDIVENTFCIIES